MLYKTIALEFLEQRPEMYEQLRQDRLLMAALEHYANQLKTSHEAWKDRLSQAKPGRSVSQIASAALELALKELEDSLPTGSPPEVGELFSLDAAMANMCRTPLA